ncbi:MAG: glycosyltransferase family 39 protein [Candidatus Obscuribacterales bacterium]|nr:glycosyltransferase family 39 protein [Candidatus Obscuribacterales bacterium]
MLQGFIEKAAEPHKAASLKSESNLPLFSLLLLSLLALFLAGPSGNFPINDDRLYAYGVKSIVDTGVFSIQGSNAFDFIPIQAGALVCKLTGFSYEPLRYLTIAFHLFGILGLYLALRELKTRKLDSALLASVYAFNPFLISLSLSFMTDVPAMALNNWSIYFAIKGMQRKRLLPFIFSLCFLTAAMSVRQTSLVLLPALVLALFVSLIDLKDRALFLVSLSIPGLAYFSLQRWLLDAVGFAGGYWAFSDLLMSALRSLSPLCLMDTVAKGLCYLGLFVLPLALTLLIAAFSSKLSRLSLSISAILTLVLVAAPLAYDQLHGAFMPYSLNLFLPPILGAYCLIGGTATWTAEHLKSFTYFCDFAALAAAFSIFLSYLAKETRPASVSPSQSFDLKIFRVYSFVLLGTVVLGLVLQLAASNLDRYYLIALSPLIIALTPLWNLLSAGRFRLLAALSSMLIAVYAVLAAADIMNFTRAQWQFVRELEAAGVNRKHIDGGANYPADYVEPLFTLTFKQGVGWPERLRGRSQSRNLRWWPVLRDDYVVATIKIDNYHVIGERRFFSPLRWKNKTMYILEADDLKQTLNLKKSGEL